MSRRVFLIVLDSAGVGQAPDAADFGDVGADTFGTCIRSGKLEVPTLTALGLYHLDGTSFEDKTRPQPEQLIGSFGKLQEKSRGKDTTVGHWELAGVISEHPLPVFPNGFPKELIEAFEQATGRKVLCNQPASGTEVIRQYGPEQEKTGALIVYTSADSVFQIAAHEDVIPLEELYEDCRKARALLTGEYGVGRVIARPYIGTWPDYERTVHRHDFSLEPPEETMLDRIAASGLSVISVGKIEDIFAGRGITEAYVNEGNERNMQRTLELAEKDFAGLCFVNLVDFDASYGHRNDIEGYTRALNAVDSQIGALIEKLRPEDLLIVTADHGCDPGFPGTDHTREYVPVLLTGPAIRSGVNLHIRPTYADLSAAVEEYLGVAHRGAGQSFLSEVL